MRFPKGLPLSVAAVGLVAVGLAGCDAPASGPPSGSSSPSVTQSQSSPGVAQAAPGAAQRSPGSPPGGARTEPKAAAPPRPASPGMRTSAREAATRFYGLYFAGQFANSWDLLAPAAKRQIPRSVWVGVHEGCLSAGAGNSAVVKSVTVFGKAAIVTEAIADGSPGSGTVAAVFNYSNGQWGYSPGDPSVYHHGSVAADIAAAKAAGLCASRKSPLL